MRTKLFSRPAPAVRSRGCAQLVPPHPEIPAAAHSAQTLRELLRNPRMIRIDAAWLAAAPLDMRKGTDTAPGAGGTAQPPLLAGPSHACAARCTLLANRSLRFAVAEPVFRFRAVHQHPSIARPTVPSCG